MQASSGLPVLSINMSGLRAILVGTASRVPKVTAYNEQFLSSMADRALPLGTSSCGSRCRSPWQHSEMSSKAGTVQGTAESARKGI